MGHLSKKRRELKEDLWYLESMFGGLTSVKIPVSITPPQDHPDYLPGLRLDVGEMKKLKLSYDNMCSYLRDPHWYKEKFVGLCALTSFKKCEYPRTLPCFLDNNCPILLANQKEYLNQTSLEQEVELNKQNGTIIE